MLLFTSPAITLILLRCFLLPDFCAYILAPFLEYPYSLMFFVSKPDSSMYTIDSPIYLI